MKRPVLVVGAGGHARVLISTLNMMNRQIIGILDASPQSIGQQVQGIVVLGDDTKISDYRIDSVEMVNAIGSIGTPERRTDVFLKFKAAGYSFASIVHPKALVMKDVTIGEGVQIMAGAIVQNGCIIGDNTIINTGAIVDHDCVVGSHTHIAPGAVLSGGVRIGCQTHVGTAAAIIQGVQVGDHSIVGAGAVVIRDLPSSIIALGIPATFNNKGTLKRIVPKDEG